VGRKKYESEVERYIKRRLRKEKNIMKKGL
jgi:hypothetical protein